MANKAEEAAGTAGMASERYIPLEIVRAIFTYADLSTVQSLRLACYAYAAIGEEFLVSEEFTGRPWRMPLDLERLEAISGHAVMREAISTVTLNFSELNVYNARHSSYFDHFLMDTEVKNQVLVEGWQEHSEAEKRRDELFASRGIEKPYRLPFRTLQEILPRLPNLHTIRILYRRCPYESDVLLQAFARPGCIDLNWSAITDNVTTVLAAVRASCLHQVTKLECDALTCSRMASSPAEVSLPAALAPDLIHLTTVDVTLLVARECRLEVMLRRLPRSIMQLSLRLVRWPIAREFTSHPRSNTAYVRFDPADDGPLFELPCLTDLLIDGATVARAKLLSTVRANAKTLRRLRLGGILRRWPRRPLACGLGVLDGSMRELGEGLREVSMAEESAIERVDLAGEWHFLGRNELFQFWSLTDEGWRVIMSSEEARASATTGLTSEDVEDFVLGRTFEWPRHLENPIKIIPRPPPNPREPDAGLLGYS